MKRLDLEGLSYYTSKLLGCIQGIRDWEILTLFYGDPLELELVEGGEVSGLNLTGYAGEAVSTRSNNTLYVFFDPAIQTIHWYTIESGDDLLTIKIPEGVKRMSPFAVCSCPVLKSITLPNTLTSIESDAIYDCPELDTIICGAETPPTLDGGLPSTITQILVPADSVSSYKTATNWSAYSSKIKALS